MADVYSRRTEVAVTFDGADITKEIQNYLTSVTYTDDSDDLSDDLKIEVQDARGEWMENWLAQAVEATESGKLKMSAVLTKKYWGEGQDGSLKTGEFELDSVDASGPGAKVTIKGASLAFSSGIRQTQKNKAWENYTLSGIASEIAGNGGMKSMYEADADPSYERVEQASQSDIAFLKKLCEDAGLSIKASDGKLVLFDQAKYEALPPVLTIKKGEKGGYTKYKLSAKPSYASCHVSYMDAATGQVIEGTAEAGGATGSRKLEITQKVGSIGEAKALALKQLRKENKEAKTADITMPGNVWLVAGVNVQLEGWGGWSGKYIVQQAIHKVGSGGYTTQLKMRKVLGY